MTQDITSLIEKLEGAEVGSTKLDCYVGLCARTDGKGKIVVVSDKYVIKDAGGTYAAQPYTTSLDAALALAGRVLPGWVWEITILQDETSVQGAPEIWPEGLAAPDRDGVSISLRTPALALCAAILRAQSEAR